MHLNENSQNISLITCYLVSNQGLNNKLLICRYYFKRLLSLNYLKKKVHWLIQEYEHILPRQLLIWRKNIINGLSFPFIILFYYCYYYVFPVEVFPTSTLLIKNLYFFFSSFFNKLNCIGLCFYLVSVHNVELNIVLGIAQWIWWKVVPRNTSLLFSLWSNRIQLHLTEI